MEKAFTKDELCTLYRRRAARYDITANLYYLLGFREFAYRNQAVRALRLQPGETVVEIGCGTGLNFASLQQGVGSRGSIIGVDLSEAMLAKARERVQRRGWRNVELVECDAALYHFPTDVSGVLSTFALTLVPEYEHVIENASRALSPGKRMVVLDLKQPQGWPTWAVRLGVWLTRPFGVSLALLERHPWEAMASSFDRVALTELYIGTVYIAVGEMANSGGGT